MLEIRFNRILFNYGIYLKKMHLLKKYEVTCLFVLLYSGDNNKISQSNVTGVNMEFSREFRIL